MIGKVTFFNAKVEEETLKFPAGILANFLHITEIVEQFGPAVGKPYTAPMGSGLFEIRAKGKEGIGRSLFCTVKGKEIVILNSFIKKTQKTPKKKSTKPANACWSYKMSRPTLKSFKKKALKKAGVKDQYNALAPAYEIRKKLIALRQEAGFTQEQVAEKLHTNKSNISRLESVESEISPKLSTLTDYAEAIGYRLQIDFVPMQGSET